MKDKTIFPMFSMINDFESKSFHLPEIKVQHRSLYYFLLGVLMHRRGANRFELALHYGMAGAKIGNHRTYIVALQELEKHGFLKYTPGKNRFSTPIIEMQFCKPTAHLLHIYCKSTASNIKDIDDKDDRDDNEAGASTKFALLPVFNSITGRQFKTLNDKAGRQLKKLLSKGFTEENFATAIRNGYTDSRTWPKPELFTPEFITREDKFDKYLYAFGQVPEGKTKPSGMTMDDYKSQW